MSLYLKVAVGEGRYLIDTDRIIEIVENTPSAAEDAGSEGQAIPVVDLREVFGASAVGSGASVLVRQTSEEPAALLVDRVENLVDLGDSEFRALPPIGGAGLLIDAVCGPQADARPMLRLRGERALASVGFDRG